MNSQSTLPNATDHRLRQAFLRLAPTDPKLIGRSPIRSGQGMHSRALISAGSVGRPLPPELHIYVDPDKLTKRIEEELKKPNYGILGDEIQQMQANSRNRARVAA